MSVNVPNSTSLTLLPLQDDELSRMTSTMSQKQFLSMVQSIDPELGPAATQLWHEGITCEALLKKLTEEDMRSVGVNLRIRVLIFNHYHLLGKCEREQ